MKKTLFLILMVVFNTLLVSCNPVLNNKEGDRVEITHMVSKFHETDSEGEKVYKRELVTKEFLINPKRVVTYNLGVADIFAYFSLESLGITRFALPKNNLPESLNDFDKKSILDAGTLFDPNYDLLNIFNADLIILDGRTSNLYEELSVKYPDVDILDLSLTTYTYENHKFNLEVLSKIFPNIKEEATSIVNGYLESFNTIKEKASEFVALFVQTNGKIISVSTGASGRYGLLYNEFGFIAPKFKKIINENSHGTMPADNQLILEIDPDVIFIMDRNLLVGGEGSDDFTTDPMLKNLNAIKNNNIFYLDVSSWYTISGGILATNQMIKDINKFINK